MNEAKARLLIVEDDLDIAEMLDAYFRMQGFGVTVVNWGEEGVSCCLNQQPDLVILDIRLPDIEGFEVARRIRANRRTRDLPIIFLTEKRERADRLEGLSLKAEDYITKPFDESELLCKIKVILRRTAQAAPGQGPDAVPIGRYHFDAGRQELRFGERVVRLTEKENEVLQLLCRHQNRILRREEAVEKIYGKYDYFLGRSFDVFISRLRKLLKDDPGVSIDNVFRVGFILNVKE